MFYEFLKFLAAAGATGIALTALALLLTHLGRFPRWVGDTFAKAPVLDFVVSAFTWVPWVAASWKYGWPGLFGSLLGQAACYFTWIFYHEGMHQEAVRGPRIVKVINRTVGRWQNHAALWGTLIALPAFWHFRVLQYCVYPMLVGLLKFPKYKHGEWVNVSRYKFDGLVGFDLFWCLYCDWMTGVTALGIEMLRNVESFWCPIRFRDGKKCDNCKIDYPDIDKGWVPETGTMRDVTDKLEAMYGDGQRTWFNHPTRLTVKGKPVE